MDFLVWIQHLCWPPSAVMRDVLVKFSAENYSAWPIRVVLEIVYHF